MFTAVLSKRIRPGHIATKFFIKKGPHICWPCAWHLYIVTLLAPRILRWLLNFWKIFVPLCLNFQWHRTKTKCLRDIL